MSCGPSVEPDHQVHAHPSAPRRDDNFFHTEINMSQSTIVNPANHNHNAPPSFLGRVLDNEALKKGVAAAAAGALIAVVTEALWPSRS